MVALCILASCQLGCAMARTALKRQKERELRYRFAADARRD